MVLITKTVSIHKGYIMRTTKLNKSQNWELILNAINNAVAETDTLKKGTEAEFTNELLAQLDFLKPKQGGGSSTKIDADGNVYCNYFEQYIPASEFNIKLSKPNKVTGERHDTYKANCKDAEIILRKIKTLKAKYNKQVMDNFMSKTITADNMELYLNNLEEAFDGTKYETIQEVPTITEILNWHSNEETN